MDSVSKNSLQFLFILAAILSCFTVSSQETEDATAPAMIKIDSLYREDQFYFSFSYNSLQQYPSSFSQSEFSSGYAVGFLRDMPINKLRTHAIATGAGVSYNSFNQNIAITGTSDAATYSIVDTDDYSKSKFSQLLIDVPIEYRWRTSTYESYKFWRIYGGVKFSYVVYDRSVYDDGSRVVITNNKDMNKLLYGLYLSAGYNSINVYTYYGLNSVFKDGTMVDDESLKVHTLTIGLIFYIL